MSTPAPSREKATSLLKTLSRINWNFENADSRRSIHSFHSYPAKFIPEIPRSLIQTLPPSKDSLVFDPFCGCGTTLVEAQRAGYDSVGIDLNPIACLLSRTKTTFLSSDFLSEAQRCVSKAKTNLRVLIPRIPNLSHWFSDDVSAALARLRVSIQTAPPDLRQALEATFSSIVVRVSYQDSDTRYAAVAKSISGEQVFKAFIQAARELANVSASSPPLMNRRVTVLNKSIFDVKPEDIPGSVGLVVTSPPYPNAYEYWLYHKYRMWWLGYDPLDVKSKEIGARAHFFTSRRETEDFHAQMTQVFSLLSKVMIKGAYCCFVIGDSKIQGRIVDNAKSLVSVAANFGFKLEFRTERVINPHRKSFNLNHARQKHEHVLIWER